MKFLIPLVGLALILLSSCVRETVELKFQPKEGEQFRTRISTNMEMKMDGTGQNTNMSMNMVSLMKIVETSDTLIEVENTFEKIDMKMPGVVGITPNLQKMLDSLSQQSIMISMTLSAEIREIHGLSKIFQGDTMMSTNVTQHINQSFSQGLAYLPNQTIAVGETWSNKVVQKKQMGMSNIIRNTWILDKVEGNTAYISLKSVVEVKVENQNSHVDIQQEGSMQVDIPSGMTMKGQLEQQMSMDMGMATMNAKTMLTIETKKL